VNKTYVFDTNNLQWSTRKALPANRRRGSAASVLVGRRIYVSHGSRGGHATSANSNVVTVGWLDYYDIDSDTWTTNLPTAPNPRDHTGGGLVNDGTMLCVSGGRNGAVVGWPAVAATDCFDLIRGIWTVAADIPVPRSGSSYGTTCDGQLMIAGGEGPKVVYSDVHVFDGTTWVQMPNLSQARHGSGLAVDCSCASSNKVLLPSGSGGPKGGPLLFSLEAYVVDQRCTGVVDD
jgi:N-acetylneuraminic acid mutarotase